MKQRENLLYAFSATMDVASTLDQRKWVISFSMSNSGLSIGIWCIDGSDDREYFVNVITRDITDIRVRHIKQEMEAFADTVRDSIRKPAEANNV